MKELVAIEQLAYVSYARGLRQCPFDLGLYIHAANMNGTNGNVQLLFMGKGQG